MNLPSIGNDLHHDLPRAPLMPRFNRLRPLVRPLARLPTRSGNLLRVDEALLPVPGSSTCDPVMASHQLNSAAAFKESSFLPVLQPRLEEPCDHCSLELRTMDNAASAIITSRRGSSFSTGEQSFSSSSEHNHLPFQPEFPNSCKLPMMHPKEIPQLEVHPMDSPKLVKASRPSSLTPVNNTSSMEDETPKTPTNEPSFSVVSLSPPSLVQKSFYNNSMVEMEHENLPLEIMLPTF